MLRKWVCQRVWPPKFLFSPPETAEAGMLGVEGARILDLFASKFPVSYEKVIIHNAMKCFHVNSDIGVFF